MPYKDPKKAKAYCAKYQKEHPISKEKKHQYYLNTKLKEYKKIFEEGNIFARERI